jgi:hypothetical protein
VRVGLNWGLRQHTHMNYHKGGMRTPISRFAAFAGNVDTLQGVATVTRAPTPQRPLDNAGSTIEQRYPAVVQALTLLWGHPEMNQYFEKVWSGQDASLNLDPEALSELMLLAAVHQRICPHLPARKVEEVYGAGRWADAWKPARPRR